VGHARVWLRRLVVVALVYGCAVQLGLALKVPGVSIAVFWPAAGVGAALAMTAFPKSRAHAGAVVGGVAFAGVVLNLAAHNSLEMSAGFTFANTLESAMAGTVYVRLRRTRPAPGMAMPCLIVAGATAVLASSAVALALLMPTIDDPWWQVAANFGVPDLPRSWWSGRWCWCRTG
jgi:hypothetical protein